MSSNSLKPFIKFMAIVLGGLFLIMFIYELNSEQKRICAAPGCKDQPIYGSDYCYQHRVNDENYETETDSQENETTVLEEATTDSYSEDDSNDSNSSYDNSSSDNSNSYSGSYSNSSSSNGTYSNSSSSSNSYKSNSSGSSSKKKYSNPYKSYDDGYEDVYMDDDYDDDRYNSDSDYAEGVDDALDDYDDGDW